MRIEEKQRLRIAEPEQSETELQDACDNQFRATVRQRERAEQAEAELAALKQAAEAVAWFNFGDHDDDVQVAVAQLRTALREEAKP